VPPIPYDTWEPDDYIDIADHYADRACDFIWTKLAESVVAPLVAGARGYRVAGEPDREHIRRALTAMRLPADGRSKAPKMVAGAISDGGALLMPWYSVGSVTSARSLGRVRMPNPDTWQIRPERPRMSPTTGKYAKYLALPGQALPLDVHPATPRSWLVEPARILVTEGIVKADSVLTGVLREAGVDDDILGHCGDDPSVDMAYLHGILEGLPAEHRTLVVGIGGVAGWKSHSHQWISITLQNCDVLVAFDGDVGSNPQVWRQAREMWKHLEGRHARPHLVDLALPIVGADQQVTHLRVGIDDYFAGFGRLPDLLKRSVAELPPPPGSAATIDWHGVLMDEERLVAHTERDIVEDGMVVGVQRVHEADLIARIASTLTMREMTAEIEATGEVPDIDSDARAAAETEVLVSWSDLDGERRDRTVRGPGNLLGTTPARWNDTAGADVPIDVQALPDWPPTPEWWRGAKHHRADEIERIVRWRTQGWLPVDDRGDEWALVAGPAAITRHGRVADVWSSITAADLPGYDRFGLPDPPAKEEAQAIVAEVVDALLHRIWRRPEIGAAVLGAMLRPLVPGLRPQAPLWLDGAPKSGKTTVASAIVAGWQTRAGAWGEGVPGSAMSTAASIEAALSMAPIWVIDDLAPSSDQNEAARREAVIENMIRGTYNGAMRERRTRDMKAQRSMRPRAMTIITSENPLTTESATSRTIAISMGLDEWLPSTASDGRLGGYALLCEIRDKTNAAALMVAACAQAMAERVAVDGYATVRQYFEQSMSIFEEELLNRFWAGEGADRRAAHCAVDMWVGTLVLKPLMSDADFLRAYDGVLDALSRASLAQSVAARRATPGAALIVGLRVALASGGCHLTDAKGGVDDLPLLDGHRLGGTLVGWGHGGGSLRPGGPRVGYVTVRRGVAYAVLEPTAAFDAARKAGGIPHGTKAKASWRAAWNEGLADGWSRQSLGSYTARIRSEDMVPVPLSVLVPSLGCSEDAEGSE
jgi:hypothetical protein